MSIKYRILFARTDKLGDFMLTWPALSDVRVALPNSQIDVLVAPSVAEIARACPYADNVIVDGGTSVWALTKLLKGNFYDVAVAFFSSARVSIAFWSAGIAYRLAPATKLHQFLFNHRLKQRRSHSLKPEYEYNRDLIQQLLADHGIASPKPLPGPPFWRLQPEDLKRTANQLVEAYSISKDACLVIVHPGSGGSARNLSIQQYAELVNSLESDRPLFILITAGPGESDQASALCKRIAKHAAAVHESTDGLVAFAHVIAQAKLFISGSTGPLHIAGALDIPTLAFYPRRRSSTSLRWQTTNLGENRLAFSPPNTADELDMQAIDINAAAKVASQQFLSRVKPHE